jgi:hypothetical protein
MAEHLGRRIVEVAWPSVLVALVVSSFTLLGSVGGLVLLLNSKV